MKIFQVLGFKSKKQRSAADVAKERLQIIVSHESTRKNNPDFIKNLQAEIIEVISKYIHVDQDKIKVQLERIGDQSVLEMNISLPESSGYQGIDISLQTNDATEEVADQNKAKKAEAKNAKKDEKAAPAEAVASSTTSEEKKAPAAAEATTD